jgi:thymidine kinase
MVLMCWRFPSSTAFSRHVLAKRTLFLRHFLRNSHKDVSGNDNINWKVYQPGSGLNFPSLEQQRIVETVCSQKYNVRVNAVAGSGKTTTILHIASLLGPNTSIVALLYNARLKEETRAKRDTLGLRHLEVHSFHAFAVKYYKASDAATDKGIMRLVNEDETPASSLRFDVFILDEVQDMTPELYAFICKVMKDNTRPFTIVLLGDERQNIFQFKGADARFLTLAEQVFESFNHKPWQQLHLRTSFRITQNIAKFINHNVLHFPLFTSIKPSGPKVSYYQGMNSKVVEQIGEDLLTLLQSGKYTASDIFLLAPSVKLGKADKQTPLNALANFLQREGYPYYTPISEDSKINDKVIQGKIVVSTFHQTKGLERAIVVVFSFSKDYFDFYAKGTSDSICPNTLYVALTRARDRLLLVGHDRHDRELSFLTDLKNSEHLDIKSVDRMRQASDQQTIDKSKPSVTRLTKFIPETTRLTAMQFIKIKELNARETGVKLTGQVKTGRGLTEEVFELTGLALPAMHERRTTGKESTIQSESLRIMQNATGEAKASDRTLVAQFIAEAKDVYAGDNIWGHLRLAAIYSFATSGYMNKPVQLKEYDWVKPADAEYCIDVLKKHLVGDVRYETEVETIMTRGRQVTITGRIDALTDDTMWELKCTQQLEDEHLLQLAVYAWMSHANETTTGKQELPSRPFGSRRFCLLNMRTGHLLQIVSTFEELTAVVNVLVERYLQQELKLTDDAFMKLVVKTRKPFFSPKAKVSTDTSNPSGKIKGNSLVKMKTITKPTETPIADIPAETVAKSSPTEKTKASSRAGKVRKAKISGANMAVEDY